MRKRIGVLMGGPSAERDISIKSGKAVCRALDSIKVDSVPVELDKPLDMEGYNNKILSQLESLNLDVAFIALHGEFGEDGTIQNILEDMDMLYTGSRVDASILAMDKIRAKKIFEANNIPTPRHKVLEKDELDCIHSINSFFEELGRYLVIKPYNGGSSIGLAIVSNEKDFYTAVSDAFRYSDKVMIEEYISGREITVGILDDKALPIIEIIPKSFFFDFIAKYEKGLTEYIVPAKISRDIYYVCQDTALNAHKTLGARSFSRIDIILNDKGIPYVLEVNTIPGLTETSLLPKAALAAGINFSGLCNKILDSAIW